MNLTFKKCSDYSDIEALSLIENEVFNKDRFSKHMLTTLCIYCYTVIAYIDNEPIGYVSVCIENRDTAHIVSIAVREKYRRRGIGKKLICIVLKKLAEMNISEVILEVRVSNEVAINFYKKFNFKIVKVLKNYYSDGEDAYLMILERSNLVEDTIPKCYEILRLK